MIRILSAFYILLYLSLVASNCEAVGDNQYFLTWIDDETVLIGQRYTHNNWIYSFKTNRRTRLPDLGTNNRPIPSPSGKYLLTDGWKSCCFSIVETKQASDVSSFHHMEVPKLIAPEGVSTKAWKMTHFWISDNEFCVKQSLTEYALDVYHQCDIYNIDSKRWEKSEHCFDFPYISRIDYLGRNLYGVYFSREGIVTVSIMKWTRKKGIEYTKFPEDINLAMSAPYKIYIENESDSFYALSSIPLNGKKQGVVNLEIDYYTRPSVLYHWAPEKGYRETGLCLPPFVVLRSVNSQKTAWIDSDKSEICIGTLDKSGIVHRKLYCRKINID